MLSSSCAATRYALTNTVRRKVMSGVGVQVKDSVVDVSVGVWCANNRYATAQSDVSESDKYRYTSSQPCRLYLLLYL